MKKFGLFALGLLLTLSAQAQETYNYGYGETGLAKDTVTGLRSTANAVHYAMLEMPASAVNTMQGCRITKITFKTFNPSDKPIEKDSASVIVSKSIGGTPIMAQRTLINKGDWTEVTLTNPVTIQGDEKLYVGYSLETGANDYPIGYYFTTEIMAGGTIDPIIDYIGVIKNGNLNSQTLDAMMWAGRRQLANLFLYATIEGDIPQHAVTIGSTKLSGGVYNHPGDAQTLTTYLTNSGTKNLENFHLTMTFDGQTATDQTVTSTIKPWEESAFTVTLPTSDTGLHTVTVTLSRPNGEENDYTGNNTAEVKYLVYSDSVTRNVLYEHFTTGNCTNCVAGEEKVVEALAKTTDVNVLRINHHSGFTADKLTTSDDTAMEWLFGPNYVWAPANMIDRTDLADWGALGYGGTATAGPVFGTDKSVSIDSLVHAAAHLPAFITLNATATVDENRKVTVEVDADQLYEMPQADLMNLNVVLVQDSVLAPQYLEDGSIVKSFVHDNVFRMNLAGTWGETANFVGDHLNKTYTADLSGNKWKLWNLRVVAFLADYDSTNTKNCRVYNATECPLTQVTKVQAIEDKTEGASYNLAGQRVAPGYRGIVLRGGKKYLAR